MKSNTEYKNAALSALKGNWAKAVLATVVYMAVMYFATGPYVFYTLKMQTYVRENVTATSSSGSFSSIFAETMERTMALAQDPEYLSLQQKSSGWSALNFLLSIFVIMPLSLGFLNAFLRLLKGGENEILGNTYRIATRNYWHKVWGMFLMYLFVFLWTLLLIIPGIIKCFSYAMTPFILEENPELSANEAIDRSRAMMKGHKFDLFWLFLSFIGWIILAAIPFGIGFLWLTPYMETSVAAFYEDVKADYEVNGGLI